MIIDLFLILIILFVIYNFYIVLGRSPGEQEPITPQKNKASSAPPPIITPHKEIKSVLPSFNEEAFIKGASNAFEHIVKSFINSDLKALRPWLEPPLFNEYKKRIQERLDGGLTYNLSFFRPISTRIVSVQIKRQSVLMTVAFRSEQSLSVYKDQKLLEGNPDTTEVLDDVWIFSHRIKDNNTTWFLHKTIDEHD